MLETEIPQEQESEPRKHNKFRRLVLARQIVLDTLGTEIVEIHEKEKLAYKKETNARVNLAKHKVVGHIRKLPGNYKASAAARLQCMEDLGIELADSGETYVREHERGNADNNSNGHKASFREGAVVHLHKSRIKRRSKR